MSYRIRFTLPDGRTGLWAHDYPTREAAQAAIDDRLGDTGFDYTVEEVTEPGSMAAHHVEILRKRVEELKVELATVMANLAKAPSVPVGADAPGEGGDSDRRRLEALEAFLEGNEDASLSWLEGEFNALAEGEAITAPTLAALADKLAEKEAKP